MYNWSTKLVACWEYYGPWMHRKIAHKPRYGGIYGWLKVYFFLGICQLVLMDIDATYRNVGGIFYANKQSILKKKNSWLAKP